MDPLIHKIFLGITSIALVCIAIELVPVSKRASSWNSCLKKTTETLKQVNAIKLMDDKGKEVIAVMICNGAVFEPKIKATIQK